jgi:hypothetical protein
MQACAFVSELPKVEDSAGRENVSKQVRQLKSKQSDCTSKVIQIRNVCTCTSMS